MIHYMNKPNSSINQDSQPLNNNLSLFLTFTALVPFSMSVVCILVIPLVMFLGAGISAEFRLNLDDKYLWLSAGLFIGLNLIRYIYYKMETKSLTKVKEVEKRQIKARSGAILRGEIMALSACMSLLVFLNATSYNIGLIAISILSGLSILLFIPFEIKLMSFARKVIN
jgi:accessory gene regulator protein AgrB